MRPCRRLVRRRQIGAVEPIVVQDPPDHGEGERALRAGLRREPFPRHRRGLGEARVDDHELHPFVDLRGGDARRPKGRSVVALEWRCPDEHGELGVADVALPVELLATGPLAVDELLGHRLAREIQRALANGRVPVRVGRPICPQQSGDEFLPAVLETAPVQDELVVAWSKVGMIRVDHRVEIGREIALEHVDKCPLGVWVLFVGQLLDGGGHGLCDVDVRQRIGLAQPGDGPLTEEVATFDDLGHGRVEIDRRPLVLATLRAGLALEDTDQAIRVVDRLESRLSLGTDRPLDGRRIRDRRLVRDVRVHRHRAERIAIDLGDDPVEQLDLDPAPGVALEADRIDLVGRIGQGVRGARGGGGLGLHEGRETHGGPQERSAAAGEGPELDKIPPRELTAVRLLRGGGRLLFADHRVASVVRRNRGSRSVPMRYAIADRPRTPAPTDHSIRLGV